MTNKLGCLFVDIQGTELNPEDREIIAHPMVSGVILFTRNYETRAQLKDLCRKIRSSRKLPLLIMVDQEGGRVQRFISEFTRLPYMGAIGRHYDEHPESALKLASDCGWLMATELLSAGLDLSLAPVLDLNIGLSHVIGDRAFHANPHIVAHLATAYSQGMQEAGMTATGKHFPGHGSVSLDSHVTIPIDERSINEIEQRDLIPFASLVKSGISAIMAAHIIFPNADDMPVGFSRFWLNDILRTRLGFTGVIFSDDLNMEGANISANYADRVTAAREAGCDFTLVCNNRQGVIQVLDHLSINTQQVDVNKWDLLQGDFSHMNESYQNHPRWQKTYEKLIIF